MTSLSTCISNALEISVLRLLLERNILSASLSGTSRLKTELNAFFKIGTSQERITLNSTRFCNLTILELHAHPHAVNGEKE